MEPELSEIQLESKDPLLFAKLLSPFRRPVKGFLVKFDVSLHIDLSHVALEEFFGCIMCLR